MPLSPSSQTEREKDTDTLEMETKMMEVERSRAYCINYALWEGLKAGGIAAVLGSGSVLAAHHYWPWFRSSLGISGKVGCVMVPVCGSYFLSAELSLLQAQRALEENPLPALSASEREKERKSRLREKEKEQRKITEFKEVKGGTIKPHYPFIAAANLIYDYPFKAVIACSVPTLSYFLFQEFQKEKITLSQRLIHTRVQGQMSIVAILASIMSLKEYMTRNGGKFSYD